MAKWCETKNSDHFVIKHNMRHEMPNKSIQLTPSSAVFHITLVDYGSFLLRIILIGKVLGAADTSRCAYKREDMSKKRNLDFSLLPKINGMDIFIRLDGDLEDIFKNSSVFKETYERSQASLMFVCNSNKEYDNWRNSAYLRAGLNEFYSIEDAARRDFKKSKIGFKPPKISESKNPLVHAMYMLRHVNVHADISKTDIHDTSVVSTLGEKPRNIDWKSVILAKPILDQILSLQEAKKFYENSDLKQITKWIEENQNIFGIGELFRRGLSAYCNELYSSTI